MTNELLADELRDVDVGEDREVYVDESGDLALTSGLETVEQSVMLNAAEAVRPLVGQPVDGPTLEDVQQQLRDVLEDDPQIATVNRVDVVEVDESSNTVRVRVFVRNNNDFEIGVSV